jgi:hypothetical protein
MPVVGEIVERIDGGDVRYRLTATDRNDPTWGHFHRIKKNGERDMRQTPFSGSILLFRTVVR